MTNIEFLDKKPPPSQSRLILWKKLNKKPAVFYKYSQFTYVFDKKSSNHVMQKRVCTLQKTAVNEKLNSPNRDG